MSKFTISVMLSLHNLIIAYTRTTNSIINHKIEFVVIGLVHMSIFILMGIPVISKCTGSCIVLYSIIILKTTRNVISLIVSCVKWWR